MLHLTYLQLLMVGVVISLPSMLVGGLLMYVAEEIHIGHLDEEWPVRQRAGRAAASTPPRVTASSRAGGVTRSSVPPADQPASD